MINTALVDECRALVHSQRDEIVRLCQEMVRIPSLSGDEGRLAEFILGHMQHLGYDEAWMDRAGNVIGIIKGGDGPRTIFNGHMDIVDAGNPADWAHPPFSGEVHDGHIWGRGSADMKGGLAAMISAAGLFKTWKRKPRGDVIVTAAGMEELGGWGSHLMMQDSNLQAGRAVVGEPTNLRLLAGHRGRIIFKVHIRGQSMHGSNVDYQANPLLSLAGFINGIPKLSAGLAERLSYLTIAPTALAVPPSGANVTPAEVTQTLDVRIGPAVDAEMIRARLDEHLRQNLGSGCTGSVEIARQTLRTHTGVELAVDDLVPGYEVPAGHAWAQEAEAALRIVLGRDPWGELALYTTDACHLGQAGVPTLLFGPGDIAVAHTTRERLPIEQLLESVVGYMALVV
ncbi:MAG: YgeY family selenium metabolism-linked hydrolase [Anaerolineae bacterium]